MEKQRLFDWVGDGRDGLDEGQNQKQLPDKLRVADVKVGVRFGKLVVVGDRVRKECKPRTGSKTPKRYRYLYPVLCDCGKEKLIDVDTLIRNHVISCGCYHRSDLSKRRKKHGESNTRLYRIWSHIRHRCFYVKRGRVFDRYRGRGISISPEWGQFSAFRDWSLANGYREDLTLDRIDNDGDYGPSNCRWVGLEVQGSNRSNIRMIAAFGESKSAAEWSRDPRSRANFSAIIARIYNQEWEPERAISTPVSRENKRKIKPQDVPKILEMVERGFKKTEIASHFGVAYQTIYKVIKSSGGIV